MIIGNKNISDSALSLKEVFLKEAANTKYNKIILASAFLSEKAVDELKDFLNQVSANEIIFLVGTKNHFTSPNSIKKLLGLANTYSNIQIKLPLDSKFHLKCYYFSPTLKASKSTPLDFCFIGSGNLTDSGLDSQSELLVKVSDADTVYQVSDYLETIINKSIDWNFEIERYSKDYDVQRVIIVNYKPFIPKHRSKFMLKKIKLSIISNAARTVDVVVRAGEDEEKFALESYNLLSLKYPNLNKNNWIVFSKLSLEEMKKLQTDYAIGSYFDREDSYNGTGWKISSKRKICKVGVFHIDQELRLCVLYRVNRDVISYIVTREIIGKAEELGIKDVDDQNTLPTKESMKKYIEYIKLTQKRVK